MMADIPPRLLPGAQPRFFRGGKVGCLVIHGFMAAPPEVAWLGDHLASAGHTVYVPRLTGHGIDPRHMRRMKWQDWYAHVLDGYHILRQQCEQVVLIGHSMGGLLAALVAAAHPVDALVIAASPIDLQLRLLPYLRLLDLVMPYTYHSSELSLNLEIEAEQRRRGEKVFSRVHYPRWSTRAIHEFYQLMKMTRNNLPKIQAPLLLLYAEQDETAPVRDALAIASRVQSAVIEHYTLSQGSHIIFQDVGRDEAFVAVADFVQRHTTPHSV